MALPGQRTGERKAGPDLNVNLYFVDWFYRVDPINRMIIPLGLSYLVFTVISYLVEIKRKNIGPERHFGYFSLYHLFFLRIAHEPIIRQLKTNQYLEN